MKKYFSKFVSFGMIIILVILLTLKIDNYLRTDIEIIYNVEELNRLLQADNPYRLFIDLRDREDYEEGHIPGFINIPSKHGGTVLAYIKKHELEKKQVILMCYSGGRAGYVMDYLAQNDISKIGYISFGYDIYASKINGFIPEVGECDCLADE